MPSSLGPAEILVILVVALMVLGPKRLPDAGRQVGKALSEVRRWSRDIQGEMKGAFDASDSSATAKRDPTPMTQTAATQTPATQTPVTSTTTAPPALPAGSGESQGDGGTAPAGDDTPPAKGEDPA